MTPDPYTLARGNAALRAYEVATTMTQQHRFTAAEMREMSDVMRLYASGREQPQRAAAMLRQAARDAAIVERLPRTADGVPVVPGMKVYKFDTHDGEMRCHVVEPFYEWSDPDDGDADDEYPLGVPWAFHCGIGKSATDCYSTRAAAEAAAKGGAS